MTPQSTIYRIAHSTRDFAACHALYEDGVLSKPTVVAERDGKILGYFATHKSAKAVIAGPLFAPNPIIAMRLIEAYDLVMRFAGIIQYIFWVRTDDTKWRAAVEHAGFKPIDEFEGRVWFERNLT